MLCECWCRGKSTRCRLVSLGVVGVLLLAIGGMLLFVYRLAFDAIVKQQTEIRKGTLFWTEWLEPTQRVYINYYYLNVTNKEEFLSQTPAKFVKPVLEEVGPYVYRVFLKKDQIYTVDTKPEEIHYRQRSELYFQPELSGGAEDDVITTINFPAVGLGPMVEHLLSQPGSDIPEVQKQLIYRAVNRAIRETDSDLLFTHTAGGLLFGFQDPLLTRLIDFLNVNLNGTDYDHLLPLDDMLGMFTLKNSSFGWHDFHVYTGDPEYELTNLVSRMSNQTKLDYWYGERCNMINGTDGTTRPPLRRKDERIYFFYYNMCRSTYAEFAKEVSIRRVPAWEYRVPEENFNPPKKSEYNRCFCPDDSEEEYCTHGGLLLRDCLLGLPVLVSAPHFLYGDGFYRNNTIGLKPNEDEHASVYSYEPNTGACLQASKRLMFSIYMKPNPEFAINDRIQEVFAFPIFWLNATYTINDEYEKLLYGLIVISEGVVIGLQVALLLLGVFVVCVAFYNAFKIREDNKKHLVTKKDLTDSNKADSNGPQEFTNKGFIESHKPTHNNVTSL